MRRLPIAALVALVLGPAAARAQSYAIYGADRYFPIDAQTETRSRGAVVAATYRDRDVRMAAPVVDPSGGSC